MSLLPTRVARDPLRPVLVPIGAVTVLTGGRRLVAPGPVLDLRPADSTVVSRRLPTVAGTVMEPVAAGAGRRARGCRAPWGGSEERSAGVGTLRA
ncbi:hypothetical protein ACGF1Z_14965 [Streptomyces sp. NPDC048018]|uniref:hypothetical protein n=1 Tax=Streptomyces sp. NPDC048018 TaxID=3365499 RepID=UPI0037100C49